MNNNFNYIIIGAGPAGLQTAYFLQKFKQDYIILEKSNIVGSFFQKFPIHRKLISINKVYTGNTNKDFNLRHDWNSLLSDKDELLFKNYTKEYYPHADIMVKYLNDFYIKNELNIQFNTEVTNIIKTNNNQYIINTNKEKYSCKKLIIATGYTNINKLNIFNVIDYSKLTLDKTKFINKNILVYGSGNSGYEVANYLLDTAAIIHIYGRDPVKFAWQTHYVGDLRAVNTEFLDTYQLKSQNAIMYKLSSNDDTGRWVRYNKKTKKYIINHHSIYYDYVINCTGFNFSHEVFSNIKIKKHNKKIPIINSKYESIDHKNLFFVGPQMHYHDYKKSSGAFIHGFRYLIRFFIKIETNNLITKNINNFDNLLNTIIYRINNSSGLYQMYGNLTDIIILNDDNTFTYIEELSIQYINDHIIPLNDNIILISLEYGEKYGGQINKIDDLGDSTYVFGSNRTSRRQKDYIYFLHPIFRYYKNKKYHSEHHMLDDIDVNWTEKYIHILPLKYYLKNILLL